LRFFRRVGRFTALFVLSAAAISHAAQFFVRSVRGAKGRWYSDLSAGGPATLQFAGHRLAVQAIPCGPSSRRV